MNSKHQKTILSIDDSKYLNWKLSLKKELVKIDSRYIEIDCRNLDLSCKEILQLIEIASQYNCKVIGFLSTSSKTIVSSQSLGYRSQLIVEDYSVNTLKTNDKDLSISKAHFHQGTVRSGEYIASPSDLLILGDVNPGAIVSARKNIIIWGRLLGIAHAGCNGDSQSTISALQLRPVQLRIANKVARGPEERTQFGLAEQARIVSERIIISPLDSL